MFNQGLCVRVNFLPHLKLEDLACATSALILLGLDKSVLGGGGEPCPVHRRALSSIPGLSHRMPVAAPSVASKSVFRLFPGPLGAVWSLVEDP